MLQDIPGGRTMPPEITKEYPKRAGMTLRCYGEVSEFVCAICGEKKKSKARAETTEGPACNECYGQRVVDWDRHRGPRPRFDSSITHI